MIYLNVEKLIYPIFRVFDTKCNDKDMLEKFNAKTDEGIFIEYSLSSKAHRVFNLKKIVLEKSIHVEFNETIPQMTGKLSYSFDVSRV